MAEQQIVWKNAAAAAARKVISARRSALVESLARARLEYAALMAEDEVRIKAVRKCATRIYDLEQQCAVLWAQLSPQERAGLTRVRAAGIGA